MKLKAGDRIWVTKADDRCEPGNLTYSVGRALYVECKSRNERNKNEC